MELIKTLIVDDEPLARELLESYLQQLPQFQIVGLCANAMEAFKILGKEPVDLMLLDINMPDLTGIDLLKTLKNPPKVIFTTAYDSYAVESYEHKAVDYLLKPITFSRFMKAIHKLEDTLTPETASTAIPDSNKIVFVKSEGKIIRINPDEIWFVEGYKNYVRLWSANGKLILHNTMKSMEDHFQHNPLFIRISKSYIVNLKFVTEIDGNSMKVGTESLLIGITYREEVRKLFEKYQLR
jgi:DNA-binding LytR/AlgR family response regulator